MNSYCDFGHECNETRRLPLGGGGNAILCHKHYRQELAHREPDDTRGFPTWESLDIYPEPDVIAEADQDDAYSISIFADDSDDNGETDTYYINTGTDDSGQWFYTISSDRESDSTTETHDQDVGPHPDEQTALQAARDAVQGMIVTRHDYSDDWSWSFDSRLTAVTV